MKKIFLTLCAVALALVACNKTETPATKGTPVKFSVQNINTYTVKADPIGDASKVSLYAGDPIGVYNVEGTVSGSTITATGINWTAEQSEANTASEFWAVYPTMALSANTNCIGYTIESAENVEYADNVLFASTTGKPNDASVALNFQHPFAKIQFVITNSITDDTVKSVAASGFNRTADLNVKTGEISNLDNPGEVALIASATPGTYTTVVIPQSAAPVVVVTMNSGRTYTFTLPAAYSFEAGKIATANITLSASSHGGIDANLAPVAFGFQTTDWASASTAIGSFGDAVAGGASGWWYVRGTIGGENWGDFLPLASSGENTWTRTINYTPAAAATDGDKGIKIIFINGEDKTWYGSATTPDYSTNPFLFTGLSTSGPNIDLGEAGNYEISFYSDSKDMHVKKLD